MRRAERPDLNADHAEKFEKAFRKFARAAVISLIDTSAVEETKTSLQVRMLCRVYHAYLVCLDLLATS